METPAKRDAVSPPYVSWTTFLGFIEKMEPPGIIPTQIDPTFVKTYAGSVQRLLLQSLRWLELIDPDSGRVLDPLKELVNNKADRPRLIRQLIEKHYSWVLSLDSNATEQQLNTAFADNTSAEGDTRRKAITFFLSAADYAKLQHSPLWKKKSVGRPTGSPSSGQRRTTKGRAKKGAAANGNDTPIVTPRAPESPSSKENDRLDAYFNLLLEKAKAGEALDAELANRMETILGLRKEVAPATPAESNQKEVKAP